MRAVDLNLVEDVTQLVDSCLVILVMVMIREEVTQGFGIVVIARKSELL